MRKVPDRSYQPVCLQTGEKVFVGVQTFRSAKEIKMISFRASGTSMWPIIRGGDILITEKCSAENLFCGDIVLYEVNWKSFAHRLIWKYNGFLLVKADTHFAFEKIDKFQIKGKVKVVVRDGRITDLTTPLNKILSFLLGVCLLPASFVYDFVIICRNRPSGLFLTSTGLKACFYNNHRSC